MAAILSRPQLQHIIQSRQIPFHQEYIYCEITGLKSASRRPFKFEQTADT